MVTMNPTTAASAAATLQTFDEYKDKFKSVQNSLATGNVIWLLASLSIILDFVYFLLLIDVQFLWIFCR